MLNLNGSYSTLAGNDPSLVSEDRNQPIEGLRENWQDRVIARGKPRRSNKEAKAFKEGYREALAGLVSEFLPPAYMRSLPIVRIEHQLGKIVRALYEEKTGKEESRNV